MMYNHSRYIVICENERQAKLLFEDIVAYWTADTYNTRALRGKLIINRETKTIYDPLTSIVVIPERKLFDFTYDKSSFRCRVVNGSYASRWLDARFKEKEKQNDHIES